MSDTAVAGVTAAGNITTWIVPLAAITALPTEGTWSLPLADLSAAGAVKAGCYWDFGDVSITRSPITRTRQRECQSVAQTIEVGETIDGTLNFVYNQQELAGSGVINDVYNALEGGAEVALVRAYGWSTADTPDNTMIADLYVGTVQSRSKSEPTAPEEDLKATAVLSFSARYEDIAFTGA
jgi:hypothetical protein